MSVAWASEADGCQGSKAGRKLSSPITLAIRMLNFAPGSREKRFAVNDLSLRVKSANPQGPESLRHLERVVGRLLQSRTFKVRAQALAKPALQRGPVNNGER